MFFFFNDTATTEIYTLSLHDALPISRRAWRVYMPPRGVAHAGSPPCLTRSCARPGCGVLWLWLRSSRSDRKSTRLNSSHGYISYAVFCLKKKKKQVITTE